MGFCESLLWVRQSAALKMNQEGIWNTLELCLKNCSQHQDGGQIIDVHWGFHYSNKDSLYPNAITYTYNVLAGGTCWGGSHSKNLAWPYFFGPQQIVTRCQHVSNSVKLCQKQWIYHGRQRLRRSLRPRNTNKPLP